MKDVLLFITSWCPYCKKAFELLESLWHEDPRYEHVFITVVDEEAQPELADNFDYYNVPTFYVGGVKLLEGVPSKEAVKKVLEAAVSG